MFSARLAIRVGAPATRGLTRNFFSFGAGGGGNKCDVVVVGCGVPGRGMGWYHAYQMLQNQVPSATLTDVVEPWFLGDGKDSPAGQEFGKFVDEYSGSVGFHKSLGEMPKVADGGKKLALISGRTADNPRLLTEAISAGCTHIFLEKPGAPSVPELESMAKEAEAAGVGVFMGYNKNVTKYVTDALEFERKTPGAATAFYHNNAYQPEELAECFERNSEGMLKNMAVHELALLVTYYGVRGDNIASCIPDKEYSSCQTLGGYTDFDAIGFTITTTEGKSVSVYADRCGDAGGGGYAEAVVTVDGEEKFRTLTPDDDLKSVVEAKQADNPDWMPYFHLQHDDYITLKERVCNHIVTGAEAEGIATIEVAIETLKVAEYLTPLLQKELM